MSSQGAALNNFNFQSLEVVFRYRDTQLQVGKDLSYLLKLTPNISNGRRPIA